MIKLIGEAMIYGQNSYLCARLAPLQPGAVFCSLEHAAAVSVPVCHVALSAFDPVALFFCDQAHVEQKLRRIPGQSPADLQIGDRCFSFRLQRYAPFLDCLFLVNDLLAARLTAVVSLCYTVSVRRTTAAGNLIERGYSCAKHTFFL